MAGFFGATDGYHEDVYRKVRKLQKSPEVQEMITRDSTALTAAAKESTPAEKVASLYLSFLSRQPSMEESAKATAAMKEGLELCDLAWVLLNSREFLFIP